MALLKALQSRKGSIKKHHRTIKSIGAIASGNLAGSLLGALGGVLVARFVGPEVNGQFRLFTIPLMYLSFLHIGTFDGLHRQIPFYIGKDQQDHVERLASAAGAWNVYVTYIVGFGFLLCALWGFLHGDLIAGIGWLSQVLICVGIYYGGYLGATYRTLNNFVVLARIQLIQAVTGFCFVFAVAVWGFYGLCLRSAIPAFLGVWLCHRARPLRMPLHFNSAVLKEVVRIGMPLCFWGTLYTSLWAATEYSMMLHFAGMKGVGLFAVAVIIRESISILPQAINQVLTPRVIESYARQGNIGNPIQRQIKFAIVLTLGMAILVLGITVMLDYFVQFFIPKYVDGLQIMKICMWLSVIHAVDLPTNALIANGNSWLFGRGVLVGFLIFPLAVYLLNPLVGGMLAVAIGSLIGRLVRTIVAYDDLFLLVRREAC